MIDDYGFVLENGSWHRNTWTETMETTNISHPYLKSNTTQKNVIFELLSWMC